MELDDSTSTTWTVVNIIKEVRIHYIDCNAMTTKIFIKECLKSGHDVDEPLVCYTLKYVYENPKNGFDSRVPLNRHAVRRLVSACTHKIMHDLGPIMETLRMQVLSWLFKQIVTIFREMMFGLLKTLHLAENYSQISIF